MKKSLIDRLCALQQRQLEQPRGAAADSDTQRLRASIPEPVLQRFDRWLVRRKKAVATVCNGVCGECHLKLTAAVMGALAFGAEIQQCGNCGRYLYLPENEPAIPQQKSGGVTGQRGRQRALTTAP